MVKAKAEGDDVHYAVGELAELAGVSARTLRYYEEEGLLCPSRSANGYRVYTARDAKRLASILSMRACGLSVATIHRLLARAGGDLRHVLHAHLLTLSAQRDSLDEAIDRTKAAIASLERIEQMNESDAFEALKGEKIAANERTYGKEARARWGDDAVDAANERMRSASRGEWDTLERLGEEINRQLVLAMETGDPAGSEARGGSRAIGARAAIRPRRTADWRRCISPTTASARTTMAPPARVRRSFSSKRSRRTWHSRRKRPPLHGDTCRGGRNGVLDLRLEGPCPLFRRITDLALQTHLVHGLHDEQRYREKHERCGG